MTLALAPVLGGATPASAAVIASNCANYQQKTFPTSGWNTTVSIEVCVQKDSTGVYRARALVHWVDGGSGKFNNFDLHLRLEKYDVVQKGAVCDFTGEINGQSRGDGFPCETVWGPGVAGQMTGDATVLYDLKDDGVGEFRWDLGGSPSM
ncbi:hypothetical protein HRW18_13280 [Streptomyces lunaelactis]|uniref:hypothetical protein n=1 Tax=Streptomyces lunaelactis TaxID=1535768 RepID=UPI0015849238|nr:hypothetical protein [Streptomyces lunaelactis]NUK00565.1 hypothetical protein [Streptomyces lunaelactis]NUK08961.1 hypothetical protein [Streptomyces lunaelactis]NUK14726.1 hypothetical protein [Streptomyces lunaelactis]NUK34662.1 hypothetical protein [Streptomyces lunaelactis]NUK41541.1 hypothetical protein [Streptomyces lunaelactis]